jgi:ketosteroid isomerase-like protein
MRWLAGLLCFADDATAFFPAPEPPERVAGKAAIRSRFQQVFDAIRKAASGVRWCSRRCSEPG